MNHSPANFVADFFPAVVRRFARLPLSIVVGFVVLPGAAALAGPLLPDLFPWANQSPNYMYGGSFDTGSIKNKVLYRFTGALPNIGAGPLEVREVTHPDQMQDVYQRVHQSEGGVVERLIGSFQKQPTPFGHLFLPGIAQYNLRTVVGVDGVGPIVSSQDKTSMALIDGNDYDTSWPNAPATSFYTSVNAPILGVSVGWADIYGRNLPGQWVEATYLPSGPYWLEVVVDPYNRIEESDETNNTTRILVNLTVPSPQIRPGDYNQDDTVNAADYTIWRNTLGATVSPGTGADGDGDGRITMSDFDVWKMRFGEGDSGHGTGAITHEAPEPHGIALAATLLCALFAGRYAARR